MNQYLKCALYVLSGAVALPLMVAVIAAPVLFWIWALGDPNDPLAFVFGLVTWGIIVGGFSCWADRNGP